MVKILTYSVQNKHNPTWSEEDFSFNHICGGDANCHSLCLELYVFVVPFSPFQPAFPGCGWWHKVFRSFATVTTLQFWQCHLTCPQQYSKCSGWLKGWLMAGTGSWEGKMCAKQYCHQTHPIIKSWSDAIWWGNLDLKPPSKKRLSYTRSTGENFTNYDLLDTFNLSFKINGF